MKTFVTAIVFLLVSVSLSGCATLFKGGVQEVPVTSNPSGAEIIIDGISYGTTPTTLQLDVDRSYTVVIRQGSEERTFMLRSQIGTLWIILDVVGGLVPLIVDAATGDWYELKPGQVSVTF